ncbi:MAG TPA: YdhR family protein [Desulfobacterales bacterium]|nr:YdhR family protein [Desulfobacterales bacterium]
MITTLVQIKLSETLSLDKAQDIFASTAQKYIEIQGLIRKYYLLSEDGETAGGVYLWESRKAAETLYTDEWKKFILQKYGSEPSVTYFNSPVIVDNLLGEIIKDGKK